jgi:hypothetical protein
MWVVSKYFNQIFSVSQFYCIAYANKYCYTECHLCFVFFYYAYLSIRGVIFPDLGMSQYQYGIEVLVLVLVGIEWYWY